MWTLYIRFKCTQIQRKIKPHSRQPTTIYKPKKKCFVINMTKAHRIRLNHTDNFSWCWKERCLTLFEVKHCLATTLSVLNFFFSSFCCCCCLVFFFRNNFFFYVSSFKSLQRLQKMSLFSLPKWVRNTENWRWNLINLTMSMVGTLLR